MKYGVSMGWEMIPGGHWSGLRGHVQDHLGSEESAGLTEYCVCGSSVMVDEVKAKLLEYGAPPECVFTEGY